MASRDPSETGEQIPQELLRKYIMYARQHCNPQLTRIDDDKIAKLYSELRRESSVTGGIPIAVRHIESMVRMAEAHAKMHLREFVTDEDVNLAIRVMLDSFISSQKFSVKRSLERHFARYLSSERDGHELLLHVLDKMVREELQLRAMRARGQSGDPNANAERPVMVPVRDFAARAAEMQMTTLDAFFKSNLFSRNNFRVEGKQIVKTF